jgi:hypothetical protein
MTAKQRWLLLVPIMVLAMLHGGLYASFLPPWGLVDEEQHFHYIQYLAEEGGIPVMGSTMLSPEIIDSAFATKRWEHFLWATPKSHDPLKMGLEGYSYEGYQPPLYYAIMAPLYRLLPGPPLAKLFALRWASVALSLVTLLIVFQTGRMLAGDNSLLPYLACLMLAVIPERTAAIARVNNDVALEATAAALIWVCTAICLQGLTWRRSVLLGGLLGLTLLAKVSGALLVIPILAVFWIVRRSAHLLRHLLVVAGIAIAFVAPWTLRNLLLYGDLTGSSSFDKISDLPQPLFNGHNLLFATWDLFRHFWFIWWKGASASGNLLTRAVDVLLCVLCLLSIIGLYRYVRLARAKGGNSSHLQIIWVYVLTVASYGLVILLGYFGSNFPLLQGRLLIPVVAPAIQGRYFLPAISPIVLLFCWGLWHSWQGVWLVRGTAAGLCALSLISLFGNLLPYHYYWSQIAIRSAGYASMTLSERGQMFLSQLISDKPGYIQALLPCLLLLFVASLAAASVVVRRTNRLPTQG